MIFFYFLNIFSVNFIIFYNLSLFLSSLAISISIRHRLPNNYKFINIIINIDQHDFVVFISKFSNYGMIYVGNSERCCCADDLSAMLLLREMKYAAIRNCNLSIICIRSMDGYSLHPFNSHSHCC